LLNCSHLNVSIHGVQFCKFIESKLRVQLVEQIEKQVDIIEYLHIRPLKLLDSEKCPKELEAKLKGKYLVNF